MKVDLQKLRLGHSPMSDSIFAGTLARGKRVWLNKVNLTDDFIGCVIDRFGGHETEVEDAEGNKYLITVKKINKREPVFSNRQKNQ